MEKKGGDRYGSQSRIDAKKKNPVRHFSVLQLKLIFPRKNKVAELAVDPVLGDTVNYKTAEIHHYAEIFRPPTGKLNYFTPGWSCVIQVGFRLKNEQLHGEFIGGVWIDDRRHSKLPNYQMSSACDNI